VTIFILCGKSRGLSQDEFAENLGVSRQAVSKWERNEAYPDTENLIAIAKFFNVKIDDLINTPINVDGGINNDHAPIPNKVIEYSEDGGENDDDHDDEDEDEEDHNSNQTSAASYIWSSVPFAIIATIAYLLIGFFIEGGWSVGWTIFLLVPVYYSVTDCIRRKSFSSFNYSVFVTFLFLLFGMLYSVWHPLWIIYLTVPVYYPIASAIDSAIRNRNKNK